MTKKIYITGCARSGTTLLARLFHAFENCQVMSEECQLHEFAGIDMSDQSCDYLIGKRTEHTIFSNTISAGQVKLHEELIEKNKLIIINCVRDGRDVVASWDRAWGMYDPQAWMNAIIQSQHKAHLIDMTVKYEDLAENPDKIQSRIIRDIDVDGKGLLPRYDFSEYPLFVPDTSFKTIDEKYRLKPISPQKSNHNDIYLNRPNDIDMFKGLLEDLKYVV